MFFAPKASAVEGSLMKGMTIARAAATTRPPQSRTTTLTSICFDSFSKALSQLHLSQLGDGLFHTEGDRRGNCLVCYSFIIIMFSNIFFLHHYRWMMQKQNNV
jgi:hypothetical protein